MTAVHGTGMFYFANQFVAQFVATAGKFQEFWKVSVVFMVKLIKHYYYYFAQHPEHFTAIEICHAVSAIANIAFTLAGMCSQVSCKRDWII
jgi:hypothetical protein